MRLLVVLLSVIALSAFVANALVRRDKITRRVRRAMLWFQGILVYIVYGNVVAYQEGYKFNQATVFGLVMLVGLIISFLWHPEGDDKRPPDDGSLGQKVLDAFKTAYKYYRGKHDRASE